MSGELRRALDQVARRFRSERLWSGLAICWLALALSGWGAWALRSAHSSLPPATSTDSVLAALAALAALSGLACAIFARWSVRGPRWVARRIEAKHADLAAGLLTAIEEVEAAGNAPLGFLRESVVREALAHRRYHDWNETVPTGRIRAAKIACAFALALLLASGAALAIQERSRAAGGRTGGHRAGASEVRVDPGDAEIERGSSLLVIARFLKSNPAEVKLVIEDRETAVRGLASRTMTRSLDDPTFAARLESVESGLDYRVEFDGRTSDTFHVRVFERPELLRADADLMFPPFARLGPKHIEDVRHVTAVEGATLRLSCLLNKDVAAAELVETKGPARSIELKRDSTGTREHGNEHDHVYSALWRLTEPGRYRLRMIDAEGRRNANEPEIVVNVTRNRPPIIQWSRPAHDTSVSPIEELTLQARIEDDYGVTRHGLSYNRAGQAPREVVLNAPAPAGAGPSGAKLDVDHVLDFETMKAQPDEIVSYFLWAEDVGPDGNPRRVSSDMFFAEVRPFDEIFRQGEQPPNGANENDNENGGENARRAEQLVELQKQIINGTWNVVRRETGPAPTDKLAEDARALEGSQKAAARQAGELGRRPGDAKSKAGLESALRLMEEARSRLADAGANNSAGPLTPALAAEQAAYQALLKLRDHEFRVARGGRQNGRGGRSGGGPSQRQLQQLQLSRDENRFEQQRTARSEQGQPRRERERGEDRQVLSRLRELAQRQHDMNQRTKELQSALEAAKTPEERTEIERRLKRLRERQEEILRDADELRERMEREDNAGRMAEARRRMEQGREHVREAARALQEGQLSRAVTEGARAGERLEGLRDEFRQRAANRFREAMNGLRDQTRKLDDAQKEIARELEANDREKTGPPSLRGSEDRARTKQEAREQRTRLDRILEQMRRTTGDAEDTEPLLAKALYEAVRKAARQKIPESLEATQQLVEAGFPEEAAPPARQAARGIRELRQGVDRAAKSVLGDDTAALRRARNELDDLAEQLNREIARGTKNSTKPDQARNEQQVQGQGKGQGQQQDGERGQDQARNEQQAQGQGQGQGQQQGSERGRSPRGRAEAANRGGLDRLAERLRDAPGGPEGGPGGPITGNGFRQWSDRMRDVEELLDDPEWRATAARARDRVRGARLELKRHSREPDWSKLQTLVAEPIRELERRITDELRRRASPDALAPIDRDPVPPRFAESVRRYQERLGTGR